MIITNRHHEFVRSIFQWSRILHREKNGSENESTHNVCVHACYFILRQLHVRMLYFIFETPNLQVSFISFQMRLMEAKTRSGRVTSVTSVQ